MAASHHPGFDRNANGAIRSADLQNPTLEPNMKSIQWPIPEIWTFEIFQGGSRPPSWIWSYQK